MPLRSPFPRIHSGAVEGGRGGAGDGVSLVLLRVYGVARPRGKGGARGDVPLGTPLPCEWDRGGMSSYREGRSRGKGRGRWRCTPFPRVHGGAAEGGSGGAACPCLPFHAWRRGQGKGWDWGDRGMRRRAPSLLPCKREGRDRGEMKGRRGWGCGPSSFTNGEQRRWAMGNGRREECTIYDSQFCDATARKPPPPSCALTTAAPFARRSAAHNACWRPESLSPPPPLLPWPSRPVHRKGDATPSPSLSIRAEGGTRGRASPRPLPLPVPSSRHPVRVKQGHATP
ncbi:hypothetical protein EDB86DRAFT_2830866 [Lactarius hatsudake]|nr:hypothetical protein EDB86DRAFT_2830866 [Lactarius hatsudake]